MWLYLNIYLKLKPIHFFNTLMIFNSNEQESEDIDLKKVIPCTLVYFILVPGRAH
jgi:hypothetical protein